MCSGFAFHFIAPTALMGKKGTRIREDWKQHIELKNYTEEENFQRQEHRWLRRWAISPSVANHCFGGSRGHPWTAWGTPTQLSITICFGVDFRRSNSSPNRLNLIQNQYRFDWLMTVIQAKLGICYQSPSTKFSQYRTNTNAQNTYNAHVCSVHSDHVSVPCDWKCSIHVNLRSTGNISHW